MDLEQLGALWDKFSGLVREKLLERHEEHGDGFLGMEPEEWFTHLKNKADRTRNLMVTFQAKAKRFDELKANDDANPPEGLNEETLQTAQELEALSAKIVDACVDSAGYGGLRWMQHTLEEI